MKVTLRRPIHDPTPSQGYDDRAVFYEAKEYEVEGELIDEINNLKTEIEKLKREIHKSKFF